MYLTFKCVRTLQTKSSGRNKKVKIDKCNQLKRGNLLKTSKTKLKGRILVLLPIQGNLTSQFEKVGQFSQNYSDFKNEINLHL